MVNRSKSIPLVFAPYEQLNSVPNIIVDGSATAGTVLTLSHWPKSGTPAQLKRDTSAEIVFAYLDSPDFHVDADLVSNNHFDEDGLVGIFTLTAPSTAEKYRDLLVDVANAGDFGIYKQRDAARVVFTISAYADSNMSPLPKELFLRLLTDVSDYKDLWETEDANLTATEEWVENGEGKYPLASSKAFVKLFAL